MPYILSPTSPSLLVPTVRTTVYPVTTVVPVSPVITVAPLIPTIRVEYDSGLHDSWIVQKEANAYLWNRIMDYWIHKDEMESIRKFMVVKDGKVSLVKSEAEYENNDVTKDSKDIGEMKADFLEDEIDFSKEVLRRLIIKIIEELGMKWQYLTAKREELIVVGVAKRYLKKKIREMIGVKVQKE
jgi:hypothetical protein